MKQTFITHVEDIFESEFKVDEFESRQLNKNHLKICSCPFDISDHSSEVCRFIKCLKPFRAGYIIEAGELFPLLMDHVSVNFHVGQDSLTHSLIQNLLNSGAL